MSTIPGARLFHDGQLSGRRIHVPVFLARAPEEPPDADLRAFYQRLLPAVAELRGDWRLCETEHPQPRWPGRGSEHLIVVNLRRDRRAVPWRRRSTTALWRRPSACSARDGPYFACHGGPSVHADKDGERRPACSTQRPSTALGDAMKLVIGIVRPEQTNEVLEALYRAEVRGFSMSSVQGHGGELDRVETYRGTPCASG